MAEKMYRIGEAANLLNVKTSVLRFWEEEFAQVNPIRTEKGQRLYRERDLKVLYLIQHLLYERGLTIEGARRELMQRDLVEQGSLLSELSVSSTVKPATAPSEQYPAVTASCGDSGVLCALISELESLRALLDSNPD